ncbi:MAG TPA: peptidoglycan DD-metalloendopeptidase family protein [Chitinophagaceae bacterium]|nr:peptidoglycan DD-metalloendopeptidase family protein [Chitinophagaceae bacterium]
MRNTFRLLVLALLAFPASALAQPQDKAELERERLRIQQELSEIQNLYNRVKGQTRQTLGQLNMINRKINLQEKYIGTISKELRIIDDDIYLSNLEIFRLQRQLDTLKSQYAKTVVYAYNNRSAYDYLNFLFSAKSFNDAVKRIAYLRSYRTYREKQVNTILATQALIAQRQQQQLSRKKQKNQALQNQTKQVHELAQQKKEKDAVVSKLKSQEKDLQKQIAARKKKDRDLQNAIAAIIRREIEKEKELARLKAEEERKKNVVVETPTTTTTTGATTPRVTAKKPASYLELNAKDVALGSNFLSSKGRLPWPVDNGVVTVRFGRYTIEGTHLVGDNPGITIATQVGSSVKSVFDGDVVGVYNLGDGMAVTIRHGKYFTTYSNLSSVTVRKGDGVRTGQGIGKAGRDEEGAGGQIDFLLMVETKNVNPEPWLRR